MDYKIKTLGNGNIMITLRLATRIVIYLISHSQVSRYRVTESYTKTTIFNIWGK